MRTGSLWSALVVALLPAVSAAAEQPGSWQLALLRLPLHPPAVVVLAPADAAATDSGVTDGTEGFELLQERSAKAPRLAPVPDDIFRSTLSSKEASERIARDALPKKEEPTLLEQILIPITVTAMEALDSKR